MYDIVVFGSIVQDLVSYTERFPQPGESVRGIFHTAPGGKGANQAAQAALLGANVKFIGRIGNDIFGEVNTKSLETSGVCTEHVDISENSQTGCATITVNKEGENSIVVSLGANLEIPPSRANELEQVISSAKMLICQYEISFETLKRSLEVARKNGVKTFFNFAPPDANFDKSVLKTVDILCTNESETECLTGEKVKTIEDAMKGVKYLLKLGPSVAIATLGSKGVVFASKDGQCGHVPAPQVKAVETTGAGDSFCGAMAFFIVKNPQITLFEQIRRACTIAAISVQSKGTRDSFPNAKELPAGILR